MPIDIKHVNTNTNSRVGSASSKASQQKGSTAATSAPAQTVKSDSVSIDRKSVV